jgi:hypothetical protein
MTANLDSISGSLSFPWSYSVWGGAGLALLIVGVVCNVLLTQMTYIELSRLRPARWAEARRGVAGLSWRLFLAFLLSAGVPVAAIVFLRWFPGNFSEMDLPERFVSYRALAAEVFAVVAMMVEIVLWPLVGFTLLLGAIIVVEECSFLGAIAQWWWLVRRDFSRLFLYESAAVLGGVATLAFVFPLALAAWGRLQHWGSLDTPLGFGLCLLAGLAAAPLIAYLSVAHVFIYLSLRYGYDQRRD